MRMGDLERIGVALERIAGAMETLSFWVKVVVFAGLGYVALALLLAGIAMVTMPLTGGSIGF